MIYTNQGGFPFRNPIAQGKSPSELKQIFESYDYDHVFEKDGIKIYKLMAVATDDKLDQIAQARKCVGEQFELSIASSHPNNIEFTSIEANKGIALKRYQAIQGVSFKEIYAFGDGGNDIEQFKVATTAVAMANAPANVQQKAHLITKSNDENGFTYAIKELLKI